MLWYEESVEVHEELDHERLHYNEESGHSLVALLLSLISYACFLAFIFLEIHLEIMERKSAIPLGNDLLQQLPRRAQPARVMSMPLPKTSTPPARAASTPPEPTAPPQKKAVAPRTKEVIPPPMKPPQVTQEISPAPTQTPPIPVQEPIAAMPMPENSTRHGGETVTVPATTSPPLPTRRGQSSWYRTSQNRTSTPSQSNNMNNSSEQTNAFSEIEKISAQNLNKFPSSSQNNQGNPSYGSPTGNAASADQIARNMEFELFATRLVHNICDESRQRPLHIAHAAISLHLISVSVTIERNRRITEVRFIKPSPHQAINNYLEGILRTTTAPQLPASWHDEKLTMPLHIHIRAVPEKADIWLTPIEKE